MSRWVDEATVHCTHNRTTLKTGSIKAMDRAVHVDVDCQCTVQSLFSSHHAGHAKEGEDISQSACVVCNKDAVR